jgi:hypothetical protein
LIRLLFHPYIPSSSERKRERERERDSLMAWRTSYVWQRKYWTPTGREHQILPSSSFTKESQK